MLAHLWHPSICRHFQGADARIGAHWGALLTVRCQFYSLGLVPDKIRTKTVKPWRGPVLHMRICQ